jgi:hypothetical protein
MSSRAAPSSAVMRSCVHSLAMVIDTLPGGWGGKVLGVGGGSWFWSAPGGRGGATGGSLHAHKTRQAATGGCSDCRPFRVLWLLSNGVRFRVGRARGMTAPRLCAAPGGAGGRPAPAASSPRSACARCSPGTCPSTSARRGPGRGGGAHSRARRGRVSGVECVFGGDSRRAGAVPAGVGHEGARRSGAGGRGGRWVRSRERGQRRAWGWGAKRPLPRSDGSAADAEGARPSAAGSDAAPAWGRGRHAVGGRLGSAGSLKCGGQPISHSRY